MTIFAKGLCMGASEVIHGVSASTFAVILGIYGQFLESVNAIDSMAMTLMRAGRFRSLWNHINGNFLVTLAAGIVSGLLLLTSVFTYFLENHFLLLASFLFGIILISGILFLRKVRKWTVAVGLTFVAGILFNYSLALLTPLATPDHYLLAPFAGFLAGFAVVIPGVSSAFILLLIGKYQLIVTSFSELNPGIIALFLPGSLAGLWLASRITYSMFARFHDIAVALLAGLMLGALNKVWPWRNVFEYVTSSKGDQVPAYDVSIVPWKYAALTGKDPQVFLAILMMALGVFLVVLVEKITAGLKTKI